MANECIGVSSDTSVKANVVESNPSTLTAKPKTKVTAIVTEKDSSILTNKAVQSNICLESKSEAIQIIEQCIPRPSSGDGEGADKNYVHSQNVASSIWEVVHLLDKMVAVTVVDSGGTTVEGDVQYVDSNKITVNFSAPFTGKCFCN